ncbi:serine hydrolase [Streptomyces sp. TLI_171]|uniref:serine hydrolase n=1 Tax=Streptomyces sp. TLI_171 TaxID=1938859 RepID=UPI000C1874BA|nr:serine hydrolase [Streptomyces sp. TLI_171]RKE22842.1 beta-lactamase class A [Streptomyces sp. TLI_171]
MGRVAVAAVVAGTGVAVARGAGVFVTASVVKVDLVAALLLHRGGLGGLTEHQRAAAELAVVRSDNAAASELYREVGGAAGLDAAYRALGLVETVAGRDGYWGLTGTTAADRVRLLRQVFVGGGSLEPGGRRWLAGLLGRVVPEQAWGVSAAGGGRARLKNGWLPRTATGLWVVNSTGAVAADGGRSVLVAVLSDGWPSLAEGVAAVESAACGAVRACGAARACRGTGA